MTLFRRMKAVAVVLALVAVLAVAFTAVTPAPSKAVNCCWVMICTIEEPIICWEECVPCPPHPWP